MYTVQKFNLQNLYMYKYKCIFMFHTKRLRKKKKNYIRRTILIFSLFYIYIHLKSLKKKKKKAFNAYK